MRRCFREQADDQLLALEVREVRPESGRGELRRVTALAVRAREDDAPAELAGRGDPRRGGRSETAGAASAWPSDRKPPMARSSSFASTSAERFPVPLPITRVMSSSSESDWAPG